MRGRADFDPIADIHFRIGLDQVPQMLVAGCTSSLHFRDSDVPSAQIAAELGVSHQVEGSVLRQGAAGFVPDLYRQNTAGSICCRRRTTVRGFRKLQSSARSEPNLNPL